MRNIINTTMILSALLIFWTSLTVFAGDISDKNQRNWSMGSAYLLPAGRMEVGVFQPLRYGRSDVKAS